MVPETRSTTPQQDVVIAYFSNGADAQRAIDDLLAEGFEARQIGAAFRSGSSTGTTAGAGETGGVGSSAVHTAMDSDTVGSGPASDTRAVTPSGLSTGSGSVISGAGRPGPIPGSDIPHHRSSSTVGTTPVANPLPATGGFHESPEENSWWEKLKNVFSSDTKKDSKREGIANDSSMNFGTGEGHLATYPDTNDYDYSGSAFEGAFAGMGVASTHATSIVNSLRGGGAIVSVNTAGRITDAEQCLHRNGGRVRYEALEPVRGEDGAGQRVRVYGELSRAYPGFLSGSGTPQRKAS
ncbi:hypothetical protein [Acidobacterium sp. S8]|uniref:hypothetical protein n=1 Tax=Acidobacterium sp. S8 TaxID=1641854 RepID=UPI00131CC747|nr:hypothetical protein [Acidobacterium sp. S8]